ncbi:hypothetical protein ABL78_3378 [Leptomonas seymouri]|uniref:Uncharacterized protein n=1 Tax=Leptomonas seymouri TaxID=5684 RepID=A0A0N1PBV9_LEPSE|nr:hypothetical protein ABL78_3378 [Leptomonas seymouri]|eukprot:KPI87535.1 hypothetical protein ABL78_3378 [Leptomonas seymouri]
MASFIQEPDVRTLVKITECVYAMRQTDIKSCSALYDVANNNEAPSSALLTKSIDVPLRKYESHSHSRAHDTSRPSIDRQCGEASPPVPMCSSSRAYERDAHGYPQRRQLEGSATHAKRLSPPRKVERNGGERRREKQEGEDALLSVEESGLRYSWLRGDPRHSMRRERRDHNVYASQLESERPLTEGNAYRIGVEGNDGFRTHQLNIAPLITPAAASNDAAVCKNNGTASCSPPRRVGEGRPQANKAAVVTSTFIASKDRHVRLRNDGDDGSQENSLHSRSTRHPSTYASIDLSEVKPQSSTSSTHAEAKYTDHYSCKSDKSLFSSRAPLSSSNPVGLSQCFRREVPMSPRLVRASCSADTEASEAGTRFIPSPKALQKRGGMIAAHSRSGDWEASRDDPRVRRAAAATAASVRSASPLAVTAAAAHGGDSVASHGTGASRASMRSATSSLSNENSPMPSAPGMPRYTPSFSDRADRGAGPRSSRGNTSSGGVRRDHHQREEDQRAPTHHVIASSASAATRSSESAAHFVLDIRRRFSLNSGDEDDQAAAPFHASTISGSRRRGEGRHFIDAAADWTAPLSFSAAGSGDADASLLRSHSNRTPKRERYARYITPATDGFRTAASAVHDHRLASPPVSASRPMPPLASPPQTPHRPTCFFQFAAPSLQSGKSEECNTSTEMLRAAVRRMKQASDAAMDASCISTPGPSSAEDRYALLVESARLLSSSVLVFTALAPGDAQYSTSAARSASAVFAATPLQTRGQSRRAVPLPLEEPLSFMSMQRPSVVVAGEGRGVDSSASSERTWPSKGQSAASTAADASAQRCAVPASNTMLETPQASRHSSAAASAGVPPTSNIGSSAVEQTHGQGDDAVRSSNRNWRRSDEGDAVAGEKLTARGSSRMNETSPDASRRSRYGTTAQETVTAKPTHLPFIDLLHENDSTLESSDMDAANEGAEASRTQRCYGENVSSATATRPTDGPGEQLLGGPASPHLALSSVSPLTPSQEVELDYRNLMPSSSASRGLQRCELQTAENAVAASVQDGRALPSEQPIVSTCSPRCRKTDHHAEPLRRKAALPTLTRTSGEEATTKSSCADGDALWENKIVGEAAAEDPHSGAEHERMLVQFREAMERHEQDGRSSDARDDERLASLNDGRSGQDDDAWWRPQRARVRSSRQRAGSNANTPRNSAGFSTQLTQCASTESMGSPFDWAAEDFAATHQWHSAPSGAQAEESRNSPFSAPSSSGGGASLEHMASVIPVPWRCGHASPSAEGLSGSDFSAAAPRQMRRSVSNCSSGVPAASLRPSPSPFSNAALFDAQSPRDRSSSSRSRPTTSFPRMASLASVEGQSLLSAERTPTVPSTMRAATFEVSLSELHIPHAAALFSEKTARGELSAPTGPPPTPEVAEEEGLDVLWVDASGNYFTKPRLVANVENVQGPLPRERKATRELKSSGARSSASTLHGDSSNAKYGGSAEDEEERGMDALEASRRSLRHGSASHYRHSEKHDACRSDDFKQSRNAVVPSNTHGRAEVQGNEEDGGIDDPVDDAPPLRSCYTIPYAPVVSTHESRQRGSSSSNTKGCSTMSSASTSPEPAGHDNSERRRRGQGEGSSREAGQRSSVPPSLASLPTTLTKARGGDDSDAAIQLEHARSNGTRRYHRQHSASDEDLCVVNRCSSQNTGNQTHRCRPEVGGPQRHSSAGHPNRIEAVKAAEQGKRCTAAGTRKPALADGALSGQAEAEARLCAPDTADTMTSLHAFPPLSLPNPSSKSSTLMSSSSHLPPTSPTGRGTAPRAPLSAPSALSEPPMTPALHPPRVEDSAHSRPAFLPHVPSAATPVQEERSWRGTLAASGDAARGHAFAEDADFFDEGDDDNDYCGYGYGESYVDV